MEVAMHTIKRRLVSELFFNIIIKNILVKKDLWELAIISFAVIGLIGLFITN